jgi:hypothetical protein
MSWGLKEKKVKEKTIGSLKQLKVSYEDGISECSVYPQEEIGNNIQSA